MKIREKILKIIYIFITVIMIISISIPVFAEDEFWSYSKAPKEQQDEYNEKLKNYLESIKVHYQSQGGENSEAYKNAKSSFSNTLSKQMQEKYGPNTNVEEKRQDQGVNAGTGANQYSDQYYANLKNQDEYVSFESDDELKQFIERVGKDQNFNVVNYNMGDTPGLNKLEECLNGSKDNLFDEVGVDKTETKRRIQEIVNKLKNNLNVSPNDADPDTEQDNKLVIYKLPERNPNGGEMGEVGLDQAITDGDKFLEGTEKRYDEGKIKEFSGSLYNVMLSLGVIAAIAAGGTIGLKIMLGGLEAKAEAKQLLRPYVVGCVIIFGGFGIWKLIIEIFQQL